MRTVFFSIAANFVLARKPKADTDDCLLSLREKIGEYIERGGDITYPSSSEPFNANNNISRFSTEPRTTRLTGVNWPTEIPFRF